MTAAGDSTEIEFFHEIRRDLGVELDVRGQIAVRRRRIEGVAWRHGTECGFRTGAPDLPGSAPAGFESAGTPDLPDSGAIAARAREVAGCVRACDPGARVELNCAAFAQNVAIIGPDRNFRRDTRQSAWIRVEVRVEDPGGRGRAVTEFVGTSALDDPSWVPALVERARRRVEARPAPRGEVAVVFGCGTAGLIAHELVGHGLEGDCVHRRASWLAADPSLRLDAGLTVLDDPRRGRAAWRYDDEGVQSSATALVRDGRVAGSLHDRRSAAVASTVSTGHGRRSSYREPVLPRMGCTFIAPGRRDAAELVEELSDGIVVRRIESAGTDTRSGRALFRVSDSDRVVAGRVVEPLLSHLIELDPDALCRAVEIADDLNFDPCLGSCHRAGQPLSVSVGAPTIRLGVVRVIPGIA